MSRRAVAFGGAAAGCVCSLLLAASVSLAALPEGRAYEMVSPVQSAGQGLYSFDVATEGAHEGEAVGFFSTGVFAGSPAGLELVNGYLSTREAAGWLTSPLDPPASIRPATEPEARALFEREAPDDYSPDLESSLELVRFAASATTYPVDSSLVVYVRQPDGALVESSPVISGSAETISEVSYASASVGFGHIILNSKFGALLPSDTMNGALLRLYEVTGAGAPLKLVGVDNRGEVIDPSCPVNLGSGVSAFHAVSTSGSEVFFTTNVEPAASSVCDETGKPGQHPANPAQLFMRVNGSKTVEVSRPLSEACSEVPCPEAAKRATAVFQGANVEGTKVFFMTTQPLAAADRDGGNDLYMAEIAGGVVTKLVLVSEGDATDPKRGEGAEAQSVVSISEDGSHVYFVAKGVLTTSKNGLGQSAVPGAENLYLYDTAEKTTRFVADLCSGPQASGAAADSSCPATLNTQVGQGNGTQPINDSELWAGGMERPAQSNPDGRFLVFDTYAQLIRTGPEADANAARDVYRYDAQTGAIVRVTVGEEGYDGNGNGPQNATISVPLFTPHELKEQYELATRAISEDGATIVFTTTRPLSPDAVNGQPDVYVWHEGRVGMISSGTSASLDAAPVVTLSGRDIFFASVQGLVPQDTNGVGDVYDARIGGGFPTPPAPASLCTGEACRGPLAATPPALSSGSLTQPAGEQLAPSAKVKPKKSSLKRRAGHAEHGHRRTKAKKRRGRSNATKGRDRPARRARNARRRRRRGAGKGHDGRHGHADGRSIERGRR